MSGPVDWFDNDWFALSDREAAQMEDFVVHDRTELGALPAVRYLRDDEGGLRAEVTGRDAGFDSVGR